MDQLDEFKDIIDIIQKTPDVAPPADFTAKVMLAIDAEKGFAVSKWDFLTRQRTFSLDPMLALRGQVGNQECFVYSSLIAAAHLIFASVLLIGYRNLPSTALLPPIMMLQPWIFLFLACLLGLCGFLMKRKGLIDTKIARVTNFIYIEIAGINGALLIIQFKNVFFLIPFIVTIVAATVSAGIFLALIVDAAAKKMNNPENYQHA